MKGIRLSKSSSPSIPTQMTTLQSSPKVCSPLRLQPVAKSSSPLGDAQYLSVSISCIKQAHRETILATGGVKKQRHWKRNKLLMCNKSLLKSSIVLSLLNNIVLAHSNNISASSCFVSGIGITIPDVNFMDNGCDVIDFVFGDKLSGIDVTCDNEKRKSSYMQVKMQNRDDNEFIKLEGDSVKEDEHGPNLYVKGREFCVFHLLDGMSNLDGRCGVSRTMSAVTSIRDNGGVIAHMPLELVAEFTHEEIFEKSVGYVESERSLAHKICIENFGVARSKFIYGSGSSNSLPFFESSNKNSFSVEVVGLAAFVNFGASISRYKSRMLDGVSNCNLNTSLDTCFVVYVSNALYVKLKQYAIGPTEISHYALLLCDSGFDKKICDKGSGDPLIMDEQFVMDKKFEGNIKLPLICVFNLISANDNLETIAPVNNLSLIISLSCALVYHGMSVNRDELSAMDKDYAGNVRLPAVRPFNMSSAIGNSEILASGNSSKLTFALVFEHELEKMSLVLVDKFKKMEGDARMVFDDICGRWKFIVIDANEYCIGVLHVKFLEHCMNSNEICSGYLLSTFDALHTMQKLGYKFKNQYVLQLLSSYYNMFIMGGTFPNLELLQKKNQIEQGVGKAIEDAIIQLNLNEASELTLMNDMILNYSLYSFVDDQAIFTGVSYEGRDELYELQDLLCACL